MRGSVKCGERLGGERVDAVWRVWQGVGKGGEMCGECEVWGR